MVKLVEREEATLPRPKRLRSYMLAAMHALRFATAALVASLLLAAAALGSCGPIQEITLWVCNNPATGKADTSIYDANHYVDGVFDPCHCYDPCGELPQCPILVNDGGPAADAACADAGPDGP